MDTVVTRMEQHLLRAYQDVFRRAGTEQVDMRTAAYEIAVRRVLHAVELRGF
jgi:glutamate dehydrogenase/leucine dehydrogenase